MGAHARASEATGSLWKASANVGVTTRRSRGLLAVRFEVATGQRPRRGILKRAERRRHRSRRRWPPGGPRRRAGRASGSRVAAVGELRQLLATLPDKRWPTKKAFAEAGCAPLYSAITHGHESRTSPDRAIGWGG